MKPDEPSTSGKLGRPCKLTPEKIDIICAVLSTHGVIAAASRAAGIYWQTLAAWLKRGEKDDAAGVKSKFAVLYRRVQDCNAEFEAKCVARIDAAAKAGDWKADAFLLERRFPERWGKKDRSNGNVDLINKAKRELERVLQARATNTNQGAPSVAVFIGGSTGGDRATVAARFEPSTSDQGRMAGDDRCESSQVLPALPLAETKTLP